MEWVVALIAKIREVRAEMNIPGAAELPAYRRRRSREQCGWIERHLDQIKRLARLRELAFAGAGAGTTIQIGVEGAELFLDARRRHRSRPGTRAAGQGEGPPIETELGKIAQKLGNAQFMAKAKPEAVEEQRERQAEKQAALARIGAALARLGA